jgi:hypothetical protein
MKIVVLNSLNYNIVSDKKDTTGLITMEVSDPSILSQIGKTKKFDLENLKIVDYDPFNVVLSAEEKQKRYEMYVEELIRKKYTIGQELAILRQASTKPNEFNTYNEYAEACKADAKAKYEIE